MSLPGGGAEWRSVTAPFPVRSPRLLPRRRAALGPLWSLLLASCAGPAPEALSLPPGESGSWVLSFREAGIEALQLAALEGDSDQVRFSATNRSGRIVALGYDVPLSELGLAPGNLGPAAACERRCALVAPARRYELAFTRGAAASWVTLAEVEPELLDALVPDRSPRCDVGCKDLSEVSISYGTTSPTQLVVPEHPWPSEENAADSALVAMADGSLFRVRDPLQLERVCGPSTAPAAGAFDPGRNRLWLARADGAIGWLGLDALDPNAPCPFVRTASVPAGAAPIRLALHPLRDPPELYLLQASGAFSMVSGARVTSLGSVDLPSGDRTTQIGFALAVGETAYFGGAGNDVAIYQDGIVSHQRGFRLGVQNAEAQSALTYRGDVYVGVGVYDLFVRRGGVGSILPLDEGPQRIEAFWADPKSLAVLDGRIFTCLTDGFLAEWSAATGYCQPRAGYGPYGNISITNVRGALFIIDANQDPSTERRARWLVDPRPKTCR